MLMAPPKRTTKEGDKNNPSECSLYRLQEKQWRETLKLQDLCVVQSRLDSALKAHDVDQIRHFSEQLFVYGIICEDFTLLEQAYANGIDINSRLKGNWTPLLIAASNGDIKIIEHLIDKGADIHKKTDAGESPLHLASQSGNAAVVQLLLQRRAAIHERQEYGWTPLHLASFYGHLEIVKLLLDQGAVLGDKAGIGDTPLHLACLNGHAKVVQLLLRRGASLDDKVEEGWSPLHLASQEGHLDTVKLLLEEGAPLDDKADNGWTPLHAASQQGHENIAELLIARGASLNVRTGEGFLPIHLACEYGRLEIVKLQASQGADLDSKARNGATPLHLASQNGFIEIVQFIISSGAALNEKMPHGHTPLHLASQNGHLAIVETLTAAGAGVNEKITFGFTALHLASQVGHLDTVRLLLEKGASLEGKADRGSTPLHLASLKGHAGVVQLLIERGASLEEAEAGGATPLHLASQNGHLETVRLLTESGASLQKKAAGGSNPLHSASQDGHAEVVKLLLEKGSPLDAPMEHGHSPLHIASQMGHLATVRALLAKGAALDAKTDQGFSPLHLASQNGHLDIVQCLIQTGAAALDEQTADGYTALHLASQNGHLETVELLLSKGAGLYIKDGLGRTLLEIAAEMGAAAVVQMIARSVNLEHAYLDELESKGQTLAHSLAMHQSDPVQVARKFVLSPEDLVQDIFNRSPIQLAIEKHNNETLRYYLDLKPDSLENGALFAGLLRHCTLNRNELAAKLLLDRIPSCVTGRDLLTPGNDNLNALFIAKLRGLDEVVQALREKIPDEHLKKFCECFPVGDHSRPPNKGSPSTLEVLNRRFPMFLETVNPSWEPRESATQFSIHKDIIPEVAKICYIGKANTGRVDDLVRACRVGDPVEGHSWHELDHESENSLHSCLMAHDLIMASYLIQEALRAHRMFASLRPSFSLIGSIIEATRIGPASEIDVPITFTALHKDFFVIGDSSLNLQLSKAGVNFLRRNSLEKFVGENETFNYLCFFQELLLTLERVLEAIELPTRLQIQTKNSSYKGLTCAKCREATLQQNKQAGLMPIYHCEECLPAITFTRLGPCLLFQWRRNRHSEPITTSMDLIPVFPHSASSEELFAQMVDTLIGERPSGWRKTLQKYLDRDRIINEAAALDGIYQAKVKNSPTSEVAGSLIGMKIQHFGASPNFMIRPGQAMDMEIFEDPTARHVYIALKGVKSMLDIDVKSYFLKKTFMKQQIKDFVGKKKPSEMELFYEVTTQPELKSFFEKKVNLDHLRDAIFNWHRRSININRDPYYLDWVEEDHRPLKRLEHKL